MQTIKTFPPRFYALAALLPFACSACAQHPTAPALTPAATVASISFTGPGLDGVPTLDEWNDLNGNNQVDPGEPLVNTLIQGPEFVAATHRNKNAFFATGSRLRIKARLTITAPTAMSDLHAQALCPQHPQLNLQQLGDLHRIEGTNTWEGTFQLEKPQERIAAFENFVWDWSIVINHTLTLHDQTQISGIYFTVGG